MASPPLTAPRAVCLVCGERRLQEQANLATLERVVTDTLNEQGEELAACREELAESRTRAALAQQRVAILEAALERQQVSESAPLFFARSRTSVFGAGESPARAQAPHCRLAQTRPVRLHAAALVHTRHTSEYGRRYEAEHALSTRTQAETQAAREEYQQARRELRERQSESAEHDDDPEHDSPR